MAMTYKMFYDGMCENHLVSLEWRNLLPMMARVLSNAPGVDCGTVLKIMVLYFSRVDDGNTYLPMDADAVKQYFNDKFERQNIAVEEENEGKNGTAQHKVPDELKNEMIAAADALGSVINVGLPLVGTETDNKLFILQENRLFASKYYHAVKSIVQSADRLLVPANGTVNGTAVDFRAMMDESKFHLSAAQKDIVEHGITQNLLVTGGPGTGKTASVLFLLLTLLKDNPDGRKVYMTAPSGKAAARLSESVCEGLEHVLKQFKDDNAALIERVKNIKGQTIHRLLGIGRDTGKFVHNKDNPLEADAIYIIDEASMIDVCVFASLLEAIPNDARVFILGDKNQLPSVECGAVFADLLEKYSGHKVELTESHRFPQNSEVYKLAAKINNPIHYEPQDSEFNDVKNLRVAADKNEKVYYYADNRTTDKELVDIITDTWYHAFFDGFAKECQGLTAGSLRTFEDIAAKAERAKILCALNRTTRGSENVNKVILDKFYKKKHRQISGFYPGELLMIQRNLYSLGLFNGDCGVTVQFKDDETLYFMIPNVSDLTLTEGKPDKHNEVFRLGNFYFYPIAMIGRADITSAFAITIHKSQGSGYDNVLVLLPKTRKHPLLNRQIVYTAITRTKGATYIVSNAENMKSAAQDVMIRETGLAG